MRKIISVLVIAILFTGCVNGRFHSRPVTDGACGIGTTVDGYTYTGIAYGDGKILVIPLSKIRADTEWRFFLLPIDSLGGSTAYGGSTVTIDGKTAGDMVLTSGGTLGSYTIPMPPADDSWLTATGSFNSPNGIYRGTPYIAACVHKDVKKDQEWHFTVDITDVGSVDPRGRVEW